MIIGILVGLGVITLVLSVILLQRHNRCPKCKRIMVEEQPVQFTYCKHCGHQEVKSIKKSWFHRIY